MTVFSKIVLGSYIYYPRSELTATELATFKQKLTVRSWFDQEKSIELFDDSHSKAFGVPLYNSYSGCRTNILAHLQELAKTVVDVRVAPRTTIGLKSDLYQKQQELMDKIEALCAAGVTGFIIQAPPGYGKTILGIHIMAHLGLRTLVIVPKSDLIKQWTKRLEQHSTLRASDIGWVEGGKGDWEGKKVVIGLVHSIGLGRMGNAFNRYFGTVIFDEVDRSVPPKTFASVAGMLPAKYKIGLSATVKRADGLHVVFEKHIGQVSLQGADSNRMPPKVIMVPFAPSSGILGRWAETAGRVQVRGMIISKLAQHTRRNELLAQYIAKLAKSGRRCAVLSDRKEQLVALHDLLVGMGFDKSNEVGFYVRSLNGKNMSEAARKSVARDSQIILATYPMMDRGTDIPELAGLVYATPQSDVEQSKGRIERFLAGKKEPIIIDIVDTAYPETIRWASTRLAHYRSGGLVIKKLVAPKNRHDRS